MHAFLVLDSLRKGNEIFYLCFCLHQNFPNNSKNYCVMKIILERLTVVDHEAKIDIAMFVAK
jgi:hypothetical protein